MLLFEIESIPTIQPLYVSRDLINVNEVRNWAIAAGFDKDIVATELHCTVCFSLQPMNWNILKPETSNLTVAGPGRKISSFNGGATVLEFKAPQLQNRWQYYKDNGASVAYPEYKPHLTLSYKPVNIDLTTIKPFTGSLNFGPEKYKLATANFAAK